MTKLVRDRVPEFLHEPVTHVADEEEFSRRLRDKLVEEANEFRADATKEELADVLEVIEAILEAEGWEVPDIVKLKEAKAALKGRFTKRIILDE